jgi:hypothetical protein
MLWLVWACLYPVISAQAEAVVYDGHLVIPYTSDEGTVWLMDDRRPSLYTQTFGDCQGDSLLNISRFDAAYYKDNMTVLFHLEGNSALANESVICESILNSLFIRPLLTDCSVHRRLRLRRIEIQLDFRPMFRQYPQPLPHERFGSHQGKRYYSCQPG